MAMNTIGIYSAMVGLTDIAVEVLEKTVAAHLDQYAADLEAAKIYVSLKQNSDADRVYKSISNEGP